MFNFKELQVIHDALQNYPVALERTEIIRKIFSTVSSSTFQSVAPNVRPKSDKLIDDLEPRARMVVFETERELLRLLEKLALKKEKVNGHWLIVVALPSRGLAERVGELIFTYLARQFEPLPRQHMQPFQTEFDFKMGLHISVVTNSRDMSGRTVDWAFFYNEVSGF